MALFQSGLAIKRSQYGNNVHIRNKKTLNNTLFASSIGIDYIVFDFEGKAYDITPSELSKVLQKLEKIDGSSKIIVTVAARADRFGIRTAHSDLDDFIELSESFTNLGFCLVAGNSAYLNEVEKSKSVFEIVNLGQYISDRSSNSLDIFVGTENCINPTLAILQNFSENGYKHKYIPFVLKSETSVKEAEIIRNKFSREFNFALYAPYLYTNSENAITKKLCEYILRRKKAQCDLGLTPLNCDELTKLEKSDDKNNLLRNYAENLSLYGDFNTISNEISTLHKNGFNIIVGLTLNVDLKQILTLKRACLRANELLLA
ncbi:MAG: hypothetical protein ACFFA5_04265 [Promethearchaeota archaeon]